MNKSAGPVLLLVACLFGAGCVVQSVKPWLSDESLVEDPSLLGTWHDAEGKCTAFFTGASDSDSGYDVLLVQNGRDISRFVATLHRIDDTLLLVVGPGDPGNLNGCVLLPGHLLFQSILEGNSLRLHAIDLESFGDRAARSQAPLLAGGSPNDGYALTGTTADSEAFLRAQLADPEFFDAEPLYSFRKLPAATP